MPSLERSLENMKLNAVNSSGLELSKISFSLNGLKFYFLKDFKFPSRKLLNFNLPVSVRKIMSH